MAYTAADLITAERHIAEGEAHIVRQEELVTKLEAKGRDSTVARQLLTQFRVSLQVHRDHRDLIADELGRAT